MLVLCGFWHGAEWHFVAWGAFHAILMILYYSIRTLRRRLRKGGVRRKPAAGIRVLPWALFTRWLNTIGAVFFRAPSVELAWDFLGMMFTGSVAPGTGVEWYVWVFLALCGILFAYDFTNAHRNAGARWRQCPWYLRSLGYALLAGITVFGAVNFEAPSLYFQF